MQDTKAIRPELKGLFDTIRKQAIEYASAFDDIEKSRNEYQNIIKDVNQLVESFTLKVNSEIFGLKQKYDAITKILTIETNKTLEKYQELHNLKLIQDSYSSAVDTINMLKESIERNSKFLKKNTDEFAEELTLFKTNASKEIQNVLNKGDEHIRMLIQQDREELEQLLASKFTMFESRIYKVEQSNYLINEQIDEDFKRIYTDLDKFKNKFKIDILPNVSFSTDKMDLVNSHTTRLEYEISNIYDLINKLQYSIHSQLEAANRNNNFNNDPFASHNNKVYLETQTDEEKKQNDRRLSYLEHRVVELTQNNKIASTVAITSGIISVVALILAFAL